MYKPANIREMVTPATHKKPVVTLVYGHDQRTYAIQGTIKGKFKQKSTRELNANGLRIVEDQIQFFTWYSSDLEAQDVLTIYGVDYEIIGTVENVEMRGRYAILNLRRLEGGA